MALEDKRLEDGISVAPNVLLFPSIKLLHLLNKLETCLVRVKQFPFSSMQKALNPTLKALVSRLFDSLKCESFCCSVLE